MLRWMKPLPEDLFPHFCSPSKGELSGSCFVVAHMLLCTLERSLALRWELTTRGTWMVGPNSNSRTTRGQTKHRLLFWQYWNKLHWQCQKNVLYTNIYQNFLFLEKLWLFKLCAPKKSTQSMIVSQGQSLSCCCLLSSSLGSIYNQGNKGIFFLSCFSLSYVTPLLLSPALVSAEYLLAMTSCHRKQTNEAKEARFTFLQAGWLQSPGCS